MAFSARRLESSEVPVEDVAPPRVSDVSVFLAAHSLARYLRGIAFCREGGFPVGARGPVNRLIATFGVREGSERLAHQVLEKVAQVTRVDNLTVFSEIVRDALL
jgi:hypothetical protein